MKEVITSNAMYVIPENETGYPCYDRLWVIRGSVRDHVMDNETSVKQATWMMERISDLQTIMNTYNTLFAIDSSEVKELLRAAFLFDKHTMRSRATRRLLQHVEMTYNGYDWTPILKVRGGTLIPNILQLVGLDTTQSPVYEFLHLAIDPTSLDEVKARGVLPEDDNGFKTLDMKELLQAGTNEEARAAVYHMLAPKENEWKASWIVWSFFNWLGI